MGGTAEMNGPPLTIFGVDLRDAQNKKVNNQKISIEITFKEDNPPKTRNNGPRGTTQDYQHQSSTSSQRIPREPARGNTQRTRGTPVPTREQINLIPRTTQARSTDRKTSVRPRRTQIHHGTRTHRNYRICTLGSKNQPHQGTLLQLRPRIHEKRPRRVDISRWSSARSRNMDTRTRIHLSKSQIQRKPEIQRPIRTKQKSTRRRRSSCLNANLIN